MCHAIIDRDCHEFIYMYYFHITCVNRLILYRLDSFIPMFFGALSRLPWWRHQMETCSALLALCAGNSPVTGEFPAQRPLTRSFDVFFDLHLNIRLSKQLRSSWFETPLRPLWRHCNALWYISEYFALYLDADLYILISTYSTELFHLLVVL